MRLLILTHDRDAASYRVRWGAFEPAWRGAGVAAETREIPKRGRGRFLDAARGFDVVVLQRRLLRARDFRRLRAAARRLVYDVDDALLFRPSPPHRSRLRALRFFRAVAGADAVFAGNRVLAGYARLRSARVFVVPSAVEVERAPPRDTPPGFRVVWTGQRATRPHLELIRETILGAGFSLVAVADAAPAGAAFVPWTPAAEADALASAHVGIMPLPDDPFARGKCGYKLLRYHAAGLAAVASPVGANRSIASGSGALLARTPDDWVRALARLRDDPALRARLARQGRAFVERRYAAPLLLPRLAALLTHVASL